MNLKQLKQSNLSFGGIAANWGESDWGFRLPIFPFPWRSGSLSNTLLLGITRVTLPNGISFRPTTLAGCTSVKDAIQKYIYTYRRTDHATVTSVAIDGTVISDDAAITIQQTTCFYRASA